MKFERLRLSGFKTFVDQADFIIAPGLTGIVGPNGCGKSNLVEALRWAMGETSSKSLRGGGMDDVIFAGSGTRPQREHAEVTIRLAEPPDDLPGHLAGADSLEISRKITREQGSNFRINGREARARDVQILFADAASGARSPSMVRQGQISEIIAAKPQHRRRILEDAAGVAGLHARRHEAELRLRQAEDNLVRAEDVLGQLDRQKGDLKRQARQAERYRQLSAEIRALDLALLAHAHVRAREEAHNAEAAHDAAIRDVAAATVAQGEAERARAIAAHGAETAREGAARAAQALGLLIAGREALDAETRQTETRLAEIVARRDEVDADRDAAERLGFDADEARQRLANEDRRLSEDIASARAELEVLEHKAKSATAERAKLEGEIAGHQSRLAEARAGHRAAGQRQVEALARHERLDAALRAAEHDLAAAIGADDDVKLVATLRSAVDDAVRLVGEAQDAAAQAEQAHHAARAEEQALRPRLAEAERLAGRLETEARTIRKMVETTEPGLWTAVIDKVVAQKGIETALAAALGDDLDAALEVGASRFWTEISENGVAPSLPAGIASLGGFVDAPPALMRRLAQIGLVKRGEGAALQGALHQGQRLVSREGDLWRWDGFTRRAEAPSAAARRLAERNRLADVEREAITAKTARDAAREAVDIALRATRMSAERDAMLREAARRAALARDKASGELQARLGATEAARLRLAALRLKVETLASDRAEAAEILSVARQALAAWPPPGEHDQAVAGLIAPLNTAREAESSLRGQLGALIARKAAGDARRIAIAEERAAWDGRAERAGSRLAEHAARIARLVEEHARLEEAPARLAARRRALVDELDAAARMDRDAADARAGAETALRQADEAARAAVLALSAARESAARFEALREGAHLRLASVTNAVETEIEAPVAMLAERLNGSALPDGMPVEAIEARLIDLKHDRDRIGPVNLRAEIEFGEIETQRGDLAREREEIAEAIRRLRRGIDTLNAEGRSRLRTAFDAVNGHFTTLFSRLFGGGEAELLLVEADDPLEAGLEIIARPPGKKPQLLSLLSGGEQALTAVALIFAVFLTNPSPICVLDEVDAPLDDSNVERLCDLLADMARDTETRFLVITHNPISMARMDRLYGVTMVERGVSQLVSVDLAGAERLAEAV